MLDPFSLALNLGVKVYFLFYKKTRLSQSKVSKANLDKLHAHHSVV